MLNTQRGQGLIEYVILVALVGIAAMAAVGHLSENVHVALMNITNSLGTTDSKKLKKLEGHLYTDKDVRGVDFSNFMRGASDPGAGE